MQCLKTTNDRNGNPRRVWILYGEDGNPAMVRDEGYAGRPDWGAVELSNINVSPREYRGWIKFGAERGILS